MAYILKNFLKRLGLYEAIAFITGFVLMAFELAASRILAPTIGTSIYVWTSVIGVMIAALAVGYAAGGWLADQRGKKSDVAWLLLIAALGIICTCLFYDPVLMAATSLADDPRLQGVIASTVLFVPASFIIGTISPYLAKLRVRSLERTGRSVAGLSALNSLGGISGTFLTGFVFFDYIGSRETLALLAGILLISSWPVLGWRPQLRIRLLITFALGIAITLQLIAPAQAGVVASIDTPTSHYKIVDLDQTFNKLRVLIMGPGGYQSGVYTTGPKTLAFDYTRKIASVVEAAPQKDRILIIGGGAFTLPEYFGRTYPNASIDVVEIDPELPGIAEKYFRYEPTANTRVLAKDGRAFLRENTTKYDIVVVDAYNDAAVPFSLATREYTKQLAASITPQGIVVANLIAGTNEQCLPLLVGIHSSYRSAFSRSLFYPLSNIDMSAEQNIIAVYSNNPLSWTSTLGGSATVTVDTNKPFTDNYAPTERLVQQCTGS